MIRTLSGFLGLPGDWDFLPWPHAPWIPGEGDPASDVLLGYSMGGRIALAELVRRPYRAAIIVSAGLNLEDEEERRLRREADEVWARRFETDPWPDLMRGWDAQSLFGRHRMWREESNYDRGELARTLRENSPGVLEPLERRLAEIATPVLWIAGERDRRYVEIGLHSVARLESAELWICPDASHRVPWEQPEAFIARLRLFLELH